MASTAHLLNELVVDCPAPLCTVHVYVVHGRSSNIRASRVTRARAPNLTKEKQF